MRKTQPLGIMFIAVCILGLLTAASAFALEFAPAEWLESGRSVGGFTQTDTEFEILFENSSIGAAILCGGFSEGGVATKGEDDVARILNLAGNEVKQLDEAGATEGLPCTSVKTCESSGAEVWPTTLPFLLELMLDTEDSKFYNLVKLNGSEQLPTYFILCLVLGLSISELCEAAEGTFQEVSNTATDVELLGALTPEATCNGKTLVGLMENNSANVALMYLLGNVPLAASE
jgi:hypothetical protein